ncbi:RNA helicase [Skermanella stibiiresistens SB22]|uniref:RNA helicase n=1 Tax=Skermanella stibiiresistens SB22 TaxID=1385369 RepID=W9GUZ8_9PROT|nr:helicase-related protein [Skermanella stibiiresistens]EWY36491.1 RNA helicase [Skermanella stibiiresistens SB22]
MAEITDSLERRDALRAMVAVVRGDGIEADVDVVPARWSIAGTHDFVIPGADAKRRLKSRFRATVGPVEDVERELVALLETPEGVGRNEIKALARRVKSAVKESGHVADAQARIDEWVASVAERAKAFGGTWKPQAFSDDLVRVLGFGGRTPRLETLLDALEESFAQTAGRLGVRVRRASLETASGLGVYLDSFAAARAMLRKLRLFVGPTNSGKTHAAMDRLVEGGKGAYLAPLRLLALEGQEAIETRGRACSLITGEERDVRPGADFVSSTIEMANTSRVMDTVVIDEIQMIGDHDRGWAWTAAVAGMAASEIIMTGSADAIPYIQRLAAATGEELEIVEFTRKSPLRVQEGGVTLDDIKRADALVAFSRREVLGLRAQLLQRGHSVAVIYGALSPEVRRAEARRFREGQADVLVATDAIGMGLNLPIARIVLSTTRKYDGREERDLLPPEVRQIGGRAGRYGMHEEGRVAVLEGENISPVRRALTSKPVDPEDPRPWISPATSHVKAIAQELATDSLAKVLRTAGQELLRAHQTFRMTDLEGRIQAALAVDHAKLPLETRDLLSRCPIDVRDQNQLRLLRQWAVNQGRGEPNPSPGVSGKYTHDTGTDVELEASEKAVKDLTSYAWLAYRFPDAYPEMDLCLERRQELNAFIERTLAARSLPRACPVCGTTLKATHRFRICDACHAGQAADRAAGRPVQGQRHRYHHPQRGAQGPGKGPGTKGPARTGGKPPRRKAAAKTS